MSFRNKPVYWLQNQVVEKGLELFWQGFSYPAFMLANIPRNPDVNLYLVLYPVLKIQNRAPAISAAGNQTKKRLRSWQRHWLKNTLKGEHILQFSWTMNLASAVCYWHPKGNSVQRMAQEDEWQVHKLLAVMVYWSNFTSIPYGMELQ